MDPCGTPDKIFSQLLKTIYANNNICFLFDPEIPELHTIYATVSCGVRDRTMLVKSRNSA